MKKKWCFFLTCLLVISVVLYCGFIRLTQKNTSRTTEHIKNSFGTYYVPVSIIKLTETGLPCLSVEVEDKLFSMELDLGFRGDIAIESPFIHQIPTKSFICIKSMYGFRGIESQNTLYQMPKIGIGAMTFIQPILQEYSEKSRNDAVIVQEGSSLSPREIGRIGWELFHNVNLLLDIKNSKIAFCDSLETLKKQGNIVEDFIKTPLLIDRGLVEFMAESSTGSLRCMLDTGSTWNILNTEIEAGKSIEQVAWESENILEYPSFHIGNTDFGQIAFHRIPINIPIPIDAILGMEFFEDHLVFIDFAEKHVYFQKTTQK